MARGNSGELGVPVTSIRIPGWELLIIQNKQTKPYDCVFTWIDTKEPRTLVVSEQGTPEAGGQGGT